MQVEESGPSCNYIALAVGHFPQSEEQPIWDQLVCFITVALKLLSTPSYITLAALAGSRPPRRWPKRQPKCRPKRSESVIFCV